MTKPLTKTEWEASLAETWSAVIKSTYADEIKAAVLAEREACAKVCDELVLAHPGRADLTADQCAAAIRARGNA
jgi:hypothetical protein